MSEFCKLKPTVTVRKGTAIQEVDSKLFGRIMKSVKNRETAWELWALAQTPEFKSQYKDILEFDELGEVTFPSLVKALNIEGEYEESRSCDEFAEDHHLDTKKYDSPAEAIQESDSLNLKESKFVCTVNKEGSSYKIDASPRNGVTIQKAERQTFNHALTLQIIDLMESMGFSVGFLTDPKYNGIFDPENTELVDGFLEIIKIAKGEQGEQALPEEFAHFMIEGLISNPLVQRLLNILDEETVKDILGDEYEQYSKEYEGDFNRLKKEAAGKLLGQYITKKGTIKPETVSQKKSLLSRIWSYVKSLFSKISHNDIQNRRDKADQFVADIYNKIADGSAVPLIDRNNLLDSKRLYSLQKEYDSLEKLAAEGEYLEAKHQQVFGVQKGDRKKLRALRERGDDDYKGVVDSLNLIVGHVQETHQALLDAEKLIKKGISDRQQWNLIAKNVIRKIDTYDTAYREFLQALSSIDTDNSWSTQLHLSSVAQAQVIADLARTALMMLNEMQGTRGNIVSNLVYNVSKPIFGSDRVRGIGTKRDQVMSMEQILDHATKDINFADRWFTAMSDASDEYLLIFESLVKEQQWKRDQEMIEWNAKIAQITDRLTKAGYSSDFMYERDSEGNLTGKIISPYDWETYNKELSEEKELLRDLQEKNGWSEKEYQRRLRLWKAKDLKTGKPRIIQVYIDPEMEKLAKAGKKVPEEAISEEMPNPEVYSRNAHVLDSLSEPQKEYYNAMLNIKRQMMTKIPHRGQGIYKAVNISKGLVDGILSNSTSSPLKATLDYCKRRFVRRPDDYGFGSVTNAKKDILEIVQNGKESKDQAEEIINYVANAIEGDALIDISKNKLTSIINKFKRRLKPGADEDQIWSDMVDELIAMIQAENFFIVDTDFANHRIQRLPIYYTRPLKDKNMMSTDFSGTLLAYTAMCVNYEKMNEVVDILEVMKSYAAERQIRESKNDKSLMSKFTSMGKIYKTYIETAGSQTNIYARLDDYMKSTVYEQRKADEGTVEVLGVTLDVAKTLDTIKDYTGILGLGFNVFSAVSNLSVGKLQQWIEAAGGEYFGVKDYAKAVTQYSALMPEYITEMNDPVKKGKLSLLIQTFDPMGEVFEDMRTSSRSSNPLTRILGNGALAYIGMNAGEHILHCQTMLAILNATKLTDSSTGKEISLYDALNVEEGEDGIYRLKLKEGLTYTRDVIDNSGNINTNPNYGRPLLDKDGKVVNETIELKDNAISEYLFKRRRVIRKVNDALNGAFGADDKGAAHRKAVMRLVLQFRQWMFAHYKRRFSKAHYDMDLEQWREGYYVTVGKTINSMIKDLRKGKFEFARLRNVLSDHEKANLRRALTEVSQFLVLLYLVRLGGRVKDKDRSWLDKMSLYQINRMKLEVGASMPFNVGFFENIFTLLQTPSASINTFEKFVKMLQVWNMFDEIESGRYQGWTEWQRDAFQMIPGWSQMLKAYDFDDSMFSVYERNNRS